MQTVEPIKIRPTLDHDRDFEDYCLLSCLEQINEAYPGNADIERGIAYVEDFMEENVTDDFAGTGLSFSYRNNGETTYVDFELSQDRLAIVSGGVARSDCGSDSFSEEIWSLEAGGHASEWCDVSGEAIEILNCGGTVKLIDPDDVDSDRADATAEGDEVATVEKAGDGENSAANGDSVADESVTIVKSPTGYDKIEYEVLHGEVQSGNYYYNGISEDGYFDGFCVDTTYHLFVPPIVKNHGVMAGVGQKVLEEMRTGKYVIASVGQTAEGKMGVHLVFEDESDSPYAITVPLSQTQPFFDESFDAQPGLTFKAYGGPGVHVAVAIPLKLRFVDSIPCDRQWNPAIDEVANPDLRRILRNSKRPVKVFQV